jgi:hypothetical protein
MQERFIKTFYPLNGRIYQAQLGFYLLNFIYLGADGL